MTAPTPNPQPAPGSGSAKAADTITIGPGETYTGLDHRCPCCGEAYRVESRPGLPCYEAHQFAAEIERLQTKVADLKPLAVELQESILYSSAVSDEFGQWPDGDEDALAAGEWLVAHTGGRWAKRMGEWRDREVYYQPSE